MENKENIDMMFLLLNHDVVIRKTGKRYFPIKPDIDYSKNNTISLTEEGAFLLEYIRVQRSVAEIFQQFNVNEADEQKSYIEYFEFLSREGYVKFWDMHMEGKKFLNSIAETEWEHDHIPTVASIELTTKCNFMCIHCYLDDKRAVDDEMTTSQILAVIDKLSEAGMLIVTFTGGEPLLRHDFKDIYVYAKKKGMQVEIFTNGFLLNEEMLQLFREYPPLEIDISLYGATDKKYEEVTGVKGAFTRIKCNIKRYKENGINMALKAPIMSNLEHDMSDLFALAKEFGINMRVRFDMIPTIADESRTSLQINVKRAVELYATYAKEAYSDDADVLVKSLANPNLRIGKNRYSCGLGKCTCFIDHQGKVYPCIETRPLNFGFSIFDEAFENIWCKIRKFSYEQMSEEEEKKYKCVTCKNVSICRSCPAIRERKYGSPFIVKDEDCAFTNELSVYIKKHKSL